MEKPVKYAVCWTWRKHRVVSTKKRGREVMRVWKRWYERCGYEVKSGIDSYRAYPRGLVGQTPAEVICLHEYDAERARIWAHGDHRFRLDPDGTLTITEKVRRKKDPSVEPLCRPTEPVPFTKQSRRSPTKPKEAQVPEVQTSLIAYASESKPKRDGTGSFTIHRFTASDGTVYDTLKSDVANAAKSLMNKPAIVSFEETQYSPRIVGIRVAEGVPAPAEAPSTPSPFLSKDQQIGRAVAFKGAVDLVAAGVLTIDGVEDLNALTDQLSLVVGGGS